MQKDIQEITRAVEEKSRYVKNLTDKANNTVDFIMQTKAQDIVTFVDFKIEEIGCSALVSPYKYTSTTRSLTKIDVLAIEAIALRELMHEDCPLGFSVQQHIIRFLMDQIINFRLGA